MSKACPICGVHDCENHLRIQVSPLVYAAALRVLDERERLAAAELAVQRLRSRKVGP